MAFITPLAVAKVALIELRNQLCFAGLVHRDYSTEFKKVGNTVRIRKPAQLITVPFDGDLTGEFQSISEGYVDVVMDKFLVVPVQVSSREMTLDVVSFNEQVVKPAMFSLSQYIDALLAGLYVDIPYYEAVETSHAITDIANTDKILNINKVPQADRHGVMCPKTKAEFIVLQEFLHAEKRGDTETIKKASLGEVFGISWLMNQNIKTHDATSGTDYVGDVVGVNAKAATTLAVENFGSTDKIYKGSIITIAGIAGTYVVTADAQMTTGAGNLLIYPGLASATSGGEDVTLLADAEENLVFHKNAFAMVNAPLADPIGGAQAASQQFEGLNIQVIYDWSTVLMQNLITFNFLCGVKTLTPELAMRLRDA